MNATEPDASEPATKPKRKVAKRKATTRKPAKKAKVREVEAVPLPETWRALRTAFPRQTRAAVARAFKAGGVTAEDVLALELAVVRGLLADVSKHARYLAPHLRHIATLEASIRERREDAEDAKRAKLAEAARLRAIDRVW